MAAASRATPRMLRQSARFGVRSISRTGSDNDRAVFNGVPTVAAAFRRMMPPASVPRARSAALQSMASERWPRITPTSRVVPLGSRVPGSATGASMPALTLGAPHTTGTTPRPVSTRQTLSLSAAGCASTETTRPTMTVPR